MADWKIRLARPADADDVLAADILDEPANALVTLRFLGAAGMTDARNILILAERDGPLWVLPAAPCWTIRTRHGPYSRRNLASTKRRGGAGSPGRFWPRFWPRGGRAAAASPGG